MNIQLKGRLIVAIAGIFLGASLCMAQTSSAPITFESLKGASAPKTKAVVPKVIVRRDTVKVEHTRVDTVTVNRVRVDTLRIERLRVDTLRIQASAPTAAQAAPPIAAQLKSAPAPVPITFTPASFTGMIQMWAIGGDAGYRNTYRLRRAELKATADIGGRTKATVMFDAAKSLSLAGTGSSMSVSQSSRILQDAFLSIPMSSVQFDVGQGKLPLGYEGMQSSSQLETVERALMFSDRARGGSFGDVRDLGVLARGTYQRSEYQIGLYNGSGESQNDVDKNVDKAFVGRVAAKPFSSLNLRLGVSGATGGAATADKPTRDRLGGEVEFRSGSFMLRSELMHGQDGAISRLGYYALSAYSLNPETKLLARFDTWDPDTHSEASAADVTERDFLLGATWLPPATRLKLQLAITRRVFAADITPATTQVLANIQASW